MTQADCFIIIVWSSIVFYLLQYLQFLVWLSFLTMYNYVWITLVVVDVFSYILMTWNMYVLSYEIKYYFFVYLLHMSPDFLYSVKKVFKHIPLLYRMAQMLTTGTCNPALILGHDISICFMIQNAKKTSSLHEIYINHTFSEHA